MITEDYQRTADFQKEIGELNRQKVVRQLHDGLTQTVSALAMRINYARRLIAADADAAGEELDKVEDLARAATKEIRHIIYLMRPENQETTDLISELKSLASKMGELFDQDIEVEVEDALADQLPQDVQDVVFGIAEELLDAIRRLDKRNRLLLSLSLAENDLAQLNLKSLIEGDSERYSFSELDLNNIQSYADLIGGSVIVGKESNQVQVLFPVTMTKAAGNPSV
jgi:signal transduction histidine kinase